jgi:hypothetical protein
VVFFTAVPHDVEMDVDTTADETAAHEAAETKTEASPLSSSKPSLISLSAIKEDRLLSPTDPDDHKNDENEEDMDVPAQSILRRYGTGPFTVHDFRHWDCLLQITFSCVNALAVHDPRPPSLSQAQHV